MENYAKIVFNDPQSTRFWLRTFHLEDKIEIARAVFFESEAKTMSVPIIAVHHINPDLTAYYIINAIIDAVGVSEGVGVIYFTSPEHEAKVKTAWQNNGEEIERLIQKSGKFTEVRTIETKRETNTLPER